MRIGVIASVDAAGGGVSQYSTTFIQALAELGLPDELILFYPEGGKLAAELRSLPLEIIEVPPDRTASASLRRAAWRHLPHSWRRLVCRLVYRERPEEHMHETGRQKDDLLVDAAWARWFRRLDLDLMLYPQPDKRSFQLGIPYVAAVHDLEHRLHPEFPEVSEGGLWEAREYLFSNCIRNAELVLTDSEVGRRQVIECYGGPGVTADKIRPLPFLPASYLRADLSADERQRVRALYNLPESYLFYPAQFWLHKNHQRLVEALATLSVEGLRPHLVLAGSHTHRMREATFQAVIRTAKRLNVLDQIMYLGYVPDEDMSGLYGGAACLVMPSLFGPTNIPVVEAFGLGCPVVTSDTPGMREQSGDAAVYVDPLSVDSIAAGIRRILREPGLSQELVRRGRVRAASYTRADYMARLLQVLNDAKQGLQ